MKSQDLWLELWQINFALYLPNYVCKIKFGLCLIEYISIKIEMKCAKPQTPFRLYYVNLACAPTVQKSHMSPYLRNIRTRKTRISSIELSSVRAQVVHLSWQCISTTCFYIAYIWSLRLSIACVYTASLHLCIYHDGWLCMCNVHVTNSVTYKYTSSFNVYTFVKSCHFAEPNYI